MDKAINKQNSYRQTSASVFSLSPDLSEINRRPVKQSMLLVGCFFLSISLKIPFSDCSMRNVININNKEEVNLLNFRSNQKPKCLDYFIENLIFENGQ